MCRLTNAQTLVNLIAGSAYYSPESWPTNYNNNLTMSIDMGAIMADWIVWKGAEYSDVVKHFLDPFLLFAFRLCFSNLCPIFLSSFFCFSSVFHFAAAVDLASITAKSNMSNLNIAGALNLMPLSVWNPTNEMCDKATEGALAGIKTDFCTLKLKQIKNNRRLFVVQRQRSPFIHPSSFLHLFSAIYLSF